MTEKDCHCEANERQKTKTEEEADIVSLDDEKIENTIVETIANVITKKHTNKSGKAEAGTLLGCLGPNM